MRIDLHTHSTASDGTDSPAELVRNAADAGLDILALTDHDTTHGWAEARAALRDLPAKRPLTLVLGAELSCRIDDVTVHLLGYLFDPDEPQLAEARAQLRADRLRRGEQMARRCIELGADISWEQVRRIADGGAVGRPHVARALVEAGEVSSVSEAFSSQWLADHGRAWVPKHDLDPVRAIQLVRAAGGVAVLAHPAADVRGGILDDARIIQLAHAGLAGLEADHVDHTPAQRARVRRLARELDLFVTGSSDYHGSNKELPLGAELTSQDSYRAVLAAASGTETVRSTHT